MKKLLIHIGYHKTGTTWLQHELFGNPEMDYIQPIPFDDLIEAMVKPKSWNFDPIGCRIQFKDSISRALERDMIPVISAERLSGNPHSGGYDSKELASRIASVFPQANILIVVREQCAMIFSCYKQYVRMGGSLSLRDYLIPPNDCRIPLFDFNHFEYHHLIGLYQKLLGAEQVLVLPYEMFLSDPHSFVQRIRRHALSAEESELEENLPFTSRINNSPLAWSILLQRYTNKIASRRDTLNQGAFIRSPRLAKHLERLCGHAGYLLQLWSGDRLEKRMRQFVFDMVADRYCISNRKFAGQCNLPLSNYGYQM